MNFSVCTNAGAFARGNDEWYCFHVCLLRRKKFGDVGMFEEAGHEVIK